MVKVVVLVSVVVLLILIGLLPVLAMLVQSIVVDGRISLHAYAGLFGSSDRWVSLWHSIALSSLTAVVATAVGLPLGTLLGKTDLPFRRALAVLFAIPLLVPPYIMAVSWFHLLGREGLVAKLCGRAAAEVTSDLLFGLPGCVLVLSCVFMPVVMLLTMAFLKTISPRLEEAGRSMTGWWGVLRGITIPLALPGVLLSALLVFLLALGEFGVPQYLRFSVYPVETFTQFSAFYDFRAATAGAMPLVGIALLAMIIERVYLHRRTHEIQWLPQAGEILSIPLRRYRGVCLLLVGAVCFLTVVVPLLVLLKEALSLDAYGEALTQGGDSLLRSLAYAVAAASVLTVVGFFCGYLVHYRALPFSVSIDSLTIFLFVLPSTVIGVGLILLWNRPATNFIYATPVIVVFGLVAQYCAMTSRITASALTLVPASMEEAARMAGAGWVRRVGYIVAPLVRRGLVAGWLVAFMFCLRDTGISMLVYPPGQETLPTRTFTLMANGSADLIAALCVIMVLGTLIPLGLLALALRGTPFEP